MAEAMLSSPRTLRLGSKRMTVALGLALVVLFALDVWGTYAFLTAREPGAYDFTARWAGARAYFLDGLDPYSDEATRRIQQVYYGRPAQPGEDQVLFVYPFYTVFLVAPLILLPYAWAAAIWLVLLEFSLVAGLLIVLDLYRWRPPPGLLALTALWTVLFYPHGRGIILGQFAIVVFLLLALTLWALGRRRDGLAGVALALTTIKPQVVFLVVLLLLLWAINRRCWRFVGAFASTMGALLGASFLAVPAWVSGFLRQVAAYPAYTPESVPWFLTHLFIPALGTPGEVTMTLALLAGLAWAWWREMHSSWASFHWTLGLTLVVSNLVAPRTATTNYIVFLVPLVLLFRHLYRRAGALALVGLQVTLLVSLWALFLATVDGRQEAPIMFLPLPLVMLLGLAWGRQALARPLGDER